MTVFQAKHPTWHHFGLNLERTNGVQSFCQKSSNAFHDRLELCYLDFELFSWHWENISSSSNQFGCVVSVILIQNMICFFVNRIRLGTFKIEYKTISCGVFFKKSLRNLHCRFVLCSNDQIYGGDFQNFVAFSEYMNFNYYR